MENRSRVAQATSPTEREQRFEPMRTAHSWGCSPPFRPAGCRTERASCPRYPFSKHALRTEKRPAEERQPIGLVINEPTVVYLREALLIMSSLRMRRWESLRFVVNEPASGYSGRKFLGGKGFREGSGRASLAGMTDRSSHKQSWPEQR